MSVETTIVVVATATIATAVCMAVILPILRRRMMDLPNVRSSHRAPIPRGGGLAVLVGAAAGAVSQAGSLLLVGRGLIVLAVLTGLVGLVDDLYGLRVGLRLVLQLAGGIALAVLCVDRAGIAALPALGAGMVAALWFAAFVNAFNFMDGIDGISGFTSTVAGIWTVILGWCHGEGALVVLGAAVLGASLGFLPWNVPTARVFLGDVGSYFLGAALAASASIAVAAGIDWHLAVAPLAVYLADTGSALLRRIVGRRPWQQAHREHVYQRLVDGGWTHLSAAAIVAGAAVLTCLLASVPTFPGSRLLVLAPCFLYLLLPTLVRRRGMEVGGR